jgi:hypothetical protein
MDAVVAQRVQPDPRLPVAALRSRRIRITVERLVLMPQPGDVERWFHADRERTALDRLVRVRRMYCVADPVPVGKRPETGAPVAVRAVVALPLRSDTPMRTGAGRRSRLPRHPYRLPRCDRLGANSEIDGLRRADPARHTRRVVGSVPDVHGCS